MTRARAGAVLRRRFLKHVRTGRLLQDGTHVLAAVSGGLDSTVLLHLLRFGLPSVRISVAHFDHAIRPDSRADAEWLAGICAAWSVPLVGERAAAAPRGETRARDQRYAFLERSLIAAGADCIATAHHADDQAETILFRLARGTGLKGLAGIPERRGNIVRPLLPFTRSELHDYARQCGLQWREDASNTTLQHARNRIRHGVLPALEEVHAGAARSIAALGARAAEAEAAWNEVVASVVHEVVETRSETSITLARDRLLAYHPHVRARVLRHLLAQLGSSPDRAGTRIAVEFADTGASGARVMLGGGVTLGREFDTLSIGCPDGSSVGAGSAVRIDSADAGTGLFVAGGRKHEVHWGESTGDGPALCSAVFDPSSLQFPLTLRAWRPGDRIRLAYGSKKLKKLFQERRVSQSDRERVPVLVDAAGDVLWVVGIARSSRAPAAENGFTITVMDGDTQ